jgi:arabinofuranan 3-O-arabinosyltransferase
LQLADRGQLAGAVVLAGDSQGQLPFGEARWADTDGLRRRDVDFGLVHGSGSYVLQAGERLGPDAPKDRLPVEGVRHQTVAVMDGAAGVSASSYATAVAPHPESQPMSAFDGDPNTAWETGAAVSSEGEWVELTLDEPRAFSDISIRLLDPGPGAPRPTRLRLTTDTGVTEANVADTEQPQSLFLPPGASRHVRVTLLGVVGEGGSRSLARAGLRELTLPGVAAARLLSVPGDEVARFSAPGSPPPLFAFDRSVADPHQDVRGDEENRLARAFVVPTPAPFEVSGTLRTRPGPGLDELLRTLAPGTQPEDAGARFSLGCGQGPVVRVDGTEVATSLAATLAALRDNREIAFSACGGPLELTAGPHRLETDPRAPLAVVSATLAAKGSSAAGPSVPGRPAPIQRWDSTHRTVGVGPGARSVLAVAENFNEGWTARLGGRRLRPVRLDGWRQGWVVPAGAGGTVDIRFGPDRVYRAALVLGGLALLGLGVLASGGVRGRGSSLPALAEGRQVGLTAGAAGAALVAVGGPVALVVPALLLVGRRARAPVVVAGAAFLVAGLVEALHPARAPGSHGGAFGWTTQLAALVALGAVAAAILAEAMDRPGRARTRRRSVGAGRRAGLGQQDGGQRRPPGEQAVEGASRPGDVVVGGPQQGDLDEAVRLQVLGQGPGGEEPQVPGQHPPRPTEHADAADLGEHRLDPDEEQEAVEPGSQVGRGQQQHSPGDEHPPRFGQGQVGVDQVLDDLAHEDHVEGVGAEREPGVVDAGPHTGQTSAPGAGHGPGGPVESDDGGVGEALGGEGGDGAVATTDVEDTQGGAGGRGGSGGADDRLEHPQQDLDPMGPRRTAAVDPFVERPE